MIPLAAFALASCLPVAADRDQITAGDLAAAVPGWESVAADTPIALAPIPGVARVLHAAELRRLAIRFGAAEEAAGDICFQRPTAPVPPEKMLAVMQSHLPDARIVILESSRIAAPVGALDFPLSGLHGNYWYGSVAYGGGHRFVVWARVDVKLTVKRIVAAADLKIGQPVERSQLHEEIREEVPSAVSGPVKVEELVGQIPRRAIAAGTVIQQQWLEAPPLVRKGDTVRVEVNNGAAKVETQGIAEGSGVMGQVIPVQNPDSKRRFRAQVEAAGRVSVKGSL